MVPRLYRLNALTGYETAVVVEGEKDADRLWSLGLPATCNAGGAGSVAIDAHRARSAAGRSHHPVATAITRRVLLAK